MRYVFNHDAVCFNRDAARHVALREKDAARFQQSRQSNLAFHRPQRA